MPFQIRPIASAAALLLAGAAMLYIVLPPLNSDGTFNKGEFVARLACAGVFSCLLGWPAMSKRSLSPSFSFRVLAMPSSTDASAGTPRRAR